MQLIQSTLALLLILSANLQVSSANTPCNPDDLTFRGIGKSFKIILVSPNGGGVKRTMGGTLNPIDGCVFTMTNMTMIPTGGNTYFYGIPKGQNMDDMIPRIIKATLGNYNGQDLTFTLSTVSWSDLDGIGIYSEADNRLYAKWLWVADKEEASGVSLQVNFGLLLAVLMARIFGMF